MYETIAISEFDFNRLINLTKFYTVPKLMDELKRATIINDILVEPDLVTLDSTVVYVVDNRIQLSTLVTSEVPKDQSFCISVLSELGTALIGLRENQEIRWKFSEGERYIRVLSVIYQPEAIGDIHPINFR